MNHAATAEYPFVVRVDVLDDVLRLMRVGMPSGMTSSSILRPVLSNVTILELEGLGKEIWKGVDPKQYVDELRDERRLP